MFCISVWYLGVKVLVSRMLYTSLKVPLWKATAARALRITSEERETSVCSGRMDRNLPSRSMSPACRRVSHTQSICSGLNCRLPLPPWSRLEPSGVDADDDDDDDDDEEEEEEPPVLTPGASTASLAMFGAGTPVPGAARAWGVVEAVEGTSTPGEGMERLPRESTDGGRPDSHVFIVMNEQRGSAVPGRAASVPTHPLHLTPRTSHLVALNTTTTIVSPITIPAAHSAKSPPPHHHTRLQGINRSPRGAPMFNAWPPGKPQFCVTLASSSHVPLSRA